MLQVEKVKAEISAARGVLERPCPDADATLRQLLADRFWAERQQAGILEWLPRLEDQVDELCQAHERMVAEQNARIAALEAENAALRETAVNE